MYRFEFEKVMQVMGSNNKSLFTDGSSINDWKNIAITFEQDKYTVIRGNVPAKIATIIDEKKLDNRYGIRMGKSVRRGETYHISTKEGFVILLTEINDYFARKNGLPETQVGRFNELMLTVDSEIIKGINPTISPYEWMQGDKNKVLFFDTVKRGNDTLVGGIIRKALDKFDNAVNPCLGGAFKLDTNPVTISADTYIFFSEDGKKRMGCHLLIRDADHNRVISSRNSDGFRFVLLCETGHEQWVRVVHYFGNESVYDKSDRGEVVAINRFGDNVPNEVDIIYNLTTGLAGNPTDKKTPIMLDQQKLVLKILSESAEYASLITSGNMKKDGYSKKLLLNNNK